MNDIDEYFEKDIQTILSLDDVKQRIKAMSCVYVMSLTIDDFSRDRTNKPVMSENDIAKIVGGDTVICRIICPLDDDDNIRIYTVLHVDIGIHGVHAAFFGFAEGSTKPIPIPNKHFEDIRQLKEVNLRVMLKLLDDIIENAAFSRDIIYAPKRSMDKSNRKLTMQERTCSLVRFIDPESAHGLSLAQIDDTRTKQPHMRRGHLRKLQTGKIIGVRACWVGPENLTIGGAVYTCDKRIFETLKKINISEKSS